MISPRKMKRVELTMLRRDADRVIEYLGAKGVLQISVREGPEADEGGVAAEALQRLKTAAAYVSAPLPSEPSPIARLPAEEDAALVMEVSERTRLLQEREAEAASEHRRLTEALAEARSFANLDAPFSDLEHLSYLTLRVGRVDPKRLEELSRVLGDRGVVVPLGEGGRVLAAASRKGRFALDTELAKAAFVPIAIPESFKGVPAELLSTLEARLREAEASLSAAAAEKAAFAGRWAPALSRLCESYLIASAVEQLKARLESTRSAYRLSGWIAAETLDATVSELERLTDGRVSVVSYEPDEIPEVRAGTEKVPVSLDHGRFVGGFERMVFSYGAPLYGTIDPTPFVAVSFTILFGLMFGDVGQGAILLLLGLFAGRRAAGRFGSGKTLLGRFARFAPALVAVGISSMIVGFLDGEVFANETLLIRPTRAVTAFFTGTPVDRVLHLMPEKGHLDKLFAFFAFTVAVGAALNSIGLAINIANQLLLRRYQKAFFAKTGLAGALFFWYGLFFGIRLATGGSPGWFDAAGFALPALALFFGPALYRFASGTRPALEHGLAAYVVEGLVELLETASYYMSNTVSFLRVGAFALSHAVLSFIVFELSTLVGNAPAGPVWSLLTAIAGNAVIILLEGLIVAIQVVRLHYYEFFSKFFTETGVEFSPFRFSREVRQ